MRFLVYISYIGTRFSGFQIQRNSSVEISTFDTVQGTLYKAFLHVIQANNRCIGQAASEVPNFTISATSRTDASVHAIRNAVLIHFLDDVKVRGKLFQSVNEYLIDNNYDLSINEVVHVPDTFFSRKSVLSRTYLYRFALRPHSGKLHLSPPVSEKNRTYIIQRKIFDLERAQRATELFKGVKDYGAFLPQDFIRSYPLISPVRELTEIEIKPTQPLLGGNDYYTKDYKFYEIKCSCRSFLRQMVRRISSVIIGAGSHQISLDTVNCLFENPKPSSWPKGLQVVPGLGLYLIDIKFKEEDLVFPDGTQDMH